MLENLRVGWAHWDARWSEFEIGFTFVVGHGARLDLGWFGIRIGWCDCAERGAALRAAMISAVQDALLVNPDSDTVEDIEDENGGLDGE